MGQVKLPEAPRFSAVVLARPRVPRIPCRPVERAKLLRMVLSNCAIDATSLYLTYRKPFDRVSQRAKTEEWCALGETILEL